MVPLLRFAFFIVCSFSPGNTRFCRYQSAADTTAPFNRLQGKHKNIASGTYIWIQEDPSKHYLAESFAVKP